MTISDVLGWCAAALTLITYSQKMMLPLRISAVSANICFLIWSLASQIYPTLFLHSVLLPLNGYRLTQLLQMKRQARSVRMSEGFPLEWIRSLATTVSYDDGEYIYRMGDPPDRLYYLTSGSVIFDEVDKRAEAGDTFGEVAFFTSDRERTVSARCEGPCEVMALNGSDFTRMYREDTAFNLHVVRMIAERF